MAKELKTAQIFEQRVAFIECPHCNTVETLGEELSFDNEPEENYCNSCDKYYLAVPPQRK